MSDDLITRVRALETSSLADADKTLRVVDPAIRAIVPGVRLAGPAHTVVAPDDHLPVLVAVRDAEPGSVLVVAAGSRRAIAGELFATEARRRGLAGLVVDGFVRDSAALRELGWPVYARGTTPASGTTVSPGTGAQVLMFGDVPVTPGDLVVGDDDGLVVGTPDQVAAALEKAEAIEATERHLAENMAAGRSLVEMTNLDEHLAALARGEDSALGFTV